MPKRRWCQFTLRRLIVLMAIACAYFACWIPTKMSGVGDVMTQYAQKYPHQQAAKAVAVAPLLLRMTAERHEIVGGRPTQTNEITYYVWVLGFMAEVPFMATTTVKTIKGTLPANIRNPSPRPTPNTQPDARDYYKVLPSSVPSSGAPS
jgi:hypothetical protein